MPTPHRNRGADIQTQVAGPQSSGSGSHHSSISQPHIPCSAPLCALYVGSVYELHRHMFILKRGALLSSWTHWIQTMGCCANAWAPSKSPYQGKCKVICYTFMVTIIRNLFVLISIILYPPSLCLGKIRKIKMQEWSEEEQERRDIVQCINIFILAPCFYTHTPLFAPASPRQALPGDFCHGNYSLIKL